MPATLHFIMYLIVSTTYSKCFSYIFQLLSMLKITIIATASFLYNCQIYLLLLMLFFLLYLREVKADHYIWRNIEYNHPLQEEVDWCYCKPSFPFIKSSISVSALIFNSNLFCVATWVAKFPSQGEEKLGLLHSYCFWHIYLWNL